MNNNNSVTVCGTVVKDIAFSHEIHRKKFYSMKISIPRTSGVCDTIPVIVSDYLIDYDWFVTELMGKEVCVTGEYHSYNRHTEDHNYLDLFVYARELTVLPGNTANDSITNNEVTLDGYICKKPVYRRTPLDRRICDFFIAVNRGENGMSDYIPCICWNALAGWTAKTLEVGAHVRITGRVQSRFYTKKLNEDELEQRVAYEVSIQTLKQLSENQRCTYKENTNKEPT